MSKRESVEHPLIRPHIDDLVHVLKDKNADPEAVSRCLQHLADVLEALGNSKDSELLRHYAKDGQRET